MGSSDDTQDARDGGRRRGAAARLPSSPAAERNKEPILEVLKRVLPETGCVLEIASGAGQHVVHFAAALPGLDWQPTETEPALVAAIEARRELAGCGNVLAPLALDVRRAPWPLARADAVVCINMMHIAPWEAAEGLFAGAREVLAAGGPLVLYGPFKVAGRHTAPSNRAFDANLRARDPRWGLRDIGDVCALGARTGFTLDRRMPMPANNLTLVFKRSGGEPRERLSVHGRA